MPGVEGKVVFATEASLTIAGNDDDDTSCASGVADGWGLIADGGSLRSSCFFFLLEALVGDGAAGEQDAAGKESSVAELDFIDEERNCSASLSFVLFFVLCLFFSLKAEVEDCNTEGEDETDGDGSFSLVGTVAGGEEGVGSNEEAWGDSLFSVGDGADFV